MLDSWGGGNCFHFQLLPRWSRGSGLRWSEGGGGPSESSTGPGWWRWKAVGILMSSHSVQWNEFTLCNASQICVWTLMDLPMQVTFAKRSSGSSLTSTSFNSSLFILVLFHLLLQSRLWSFDERRINHLPPPARFLRFFPAIFLFPISSSTDIVIFNMAQVFWGAQVCWCKSLRFTQANFSS